VLPSIMKKASNATAVPRVTQAALAYGLLGTLAFSFSLPATREAVEDLDPTFVGLGRALVAATLAALLLAIRREAIPPSKDWPRFAVVGVGVVVGFPLFSSLALKHLSSAHTSVIIGLLPACTAAWAVSRAHERPPKAFWLAAVAGLLATLVFAATQGVDGIAQGDLFILIAVALGGLGYAEGGALSRTYGGPQTICWALILAAPFLVLPVVLAARHGVHAGATQWLGFGYVSVVSMFLGFFAWYRALALGGVAKIGQVQLVQPILTLAWSAWLLGEQVTHSMVLAALGVVACVVATQRTRHPERVRRLPLDANGDLAQRAALPTRAE
jgi:drug/metabolite transporter (DMT)-like permease